MQGTQPRGGRKVVVVVADEELSEDEITKFIAEQGLEDQPVDFVVEEESSSYDDNDDDEDDEDFVSEDFDDDDEDFDDEEDDFDEVVQFIDFEAPDGTMKRVVVIEVDNGDDEDSGESFSFEDDDDDDDDSGDSFSFEDEDNDDDDGDDDE